MGVPSGEELLVHLPSIGVAESEMASGGAGRSRRPLVLDRPERPERAVTRSGHGGSMLCGMSQKTCEPPLIQPVLPGEARTDDERCLSSEEPQKPQAEG